MIDIQKLEFTEHRLDELSRWLSKDQKITFPKNKKPKLSIILVFYNRAELSLACLNSILEYADVDYEIIIYNNNSTDYTDQLLERIHNVKIINSKTNVGFLRACNIAAKEAKGEYILLLNNDAVIHQYAFSNALKVFEEEENVGAVGGKIILLDGSLQEAGSIIWNDGSCQGYGRGRNPNDPEFGFRREVDYCSGALLFIKTEYWENLEGFDPLFEPAYYEESDLCLRLRLLGLKTYYEPTSIITHFEFGSSEKSEHAITLQKTNRVKFIEKHQNVIWKFFPRHHRHVESARYGNMNRSKKVLFLEDRVPHEDLGSGFPRANMIVNGLIELGYEVTIYPINFHDFGDEPWSMIYRDIDPKIEILYDDNRFSHVHIDQFFQSKHDNYEFIWVSRPHNMNFINDHYPNIKSNITNGCIIYDAEALFTSRDIAKNKALNQNRPEQDLEREMQLELTYPKYSSKIVTVNNNEKQYFIDAGYTDVHVLNVAYDITPTPNVYEERSDILFVGNLDYNDAPNADSVLWFFEHCWETIKQQIPGIKLHLVGSKESDKINALSQQDEDVIIHGKVPDVTEMFDSCRVFIAPTRFAAGSPAKLFQTFSMGLPCVITPLLHSQMCLKEDEHYLVGNVEAEHFTNQVLRLYKEKSLWTNIRENALDYVSSQCDKKSFLSALSQVLN